MQHQTSQYDRYGLAISTTSADAADAYIWGLDLALSGGLGADEHFRSATEADEGFALAHAALATVEQRLRRPESARSSLRRARELAGGTTRRERQHIAVIAEAMEGDQKRALAMAEEHLDEFPGDAYILQHYTFLRLGGGCREIKAAILDKVERLEAAYGDDWYYAGTRSFYLHELNRFEESRRYAEKSLAGNRRNGHAAHSLAHCFYETSDFSSGIDFLDDWLVGYEPEAPHYPHLNWHMALFELVQGRYQRSVEIYRQTIRPSVLKGENSIMGPPVADAASIFWRHLLYGAAGPQDFQEDWREIEAFALEVAGGPLSHFNDVHCAFAFAATGNDRAMARLIDKLRKSADAGDAVAGEVALPLVLGIDAFGRGAYDETIRHIEPIIDDVPRIAGSQAQRRIFEETLLRAYMLAGRYEKAEQLLRKRLEHRHTGRDFFWLADTASSTGNQDLARMSLERARALWAAPDPTAPELALTGL